MVEKMNYGKLVISPDQVRITIPAEIVRTLDLRKRKNVKIFIEDWHEEDSDIQEKCIVILLIRDD